MAESLTICGRYTVENTETALLGEGGMGKVFLGQDTESGKHVAIKTLHTHKPETLERFQREGEILRQLDHPNIVKMLDAVEEAGKHYLIMEYVAGGDLNDLLEKEGQLSIEDTLAIAIELADALTRAHHLNAIHRDIKPANVLIAEDNTPRLKDLGIAHFQGDLRLTEEGALIGTIPYLSPEGCMGGGLDARSDIWSFGVLLYELLTGEIPFKGENAMAVVTAILQSDLPDIQEIRPEVPDAVVDLIYRMLVKSADERMPSVRLVGAELEGIIKGIDITPSNQTGKVLFKSIASGTSTFAIPKADTTQKNINLPTPATRFVGRTKEVAEIMALLKQPKTRLLTLLGPGGMGKTRLGIESADQLAQDFARGVHFVDLAPISDPEHIIATIAKVFKLEFDDTSDPKEQLLYYFHDKQLLLVMDNFEHIIEGAVLLREILVESPEVKILVTSRARLNLQDERVFDVAGMISPEHEEQIVFEDIEAVALFIQHARRARPDYQLEETDKPAVVQICQLVGGMPLGIQLAAGWVHTLLPNEISKELASDIDFLESSLQDLPERQRSMRAAFKYSWKLLPEKLQSTYQKLSVFRGGFIRKAAKEVADAGVRDLANLVNHSLLQRTPNGRFEIHELMRQFSEEELHAAGEVQSMRGRHSKYYGGLLHKLLPDLQGGDQLGALTEIEVDFENVRWAWDWALALKDFEILEYLAESLVLFGWYRTRINETSALFRQAQEALAAETETDSILAWGRMISYQILSKDYLKEKSASLEGVLAVAQSHGDDRGEALLLWALGDLAKINDNDYKKAISFYDQSAAAFKKLGDQLYWGYVLINLGNSSHELEEEEFGLSAIRQSLEIFRRTGNQFGSAHALLYIGLRILNEGNLSEAEDYFQESIMLSRKLGDRLTIANLSFYYGVLFLCRGDYEKVKQQAWEGLEIGKEINGFVTILSALSLLADVELRLENYDKAQEYHEEILSLNLPSPHMHWLTVQQGILALARGELKKGKTLFYGYLIEVPSAIDTVIFLGLWLYILGEEGRNAEAVEIMTFIENYKASLPQKALVGYPWFQRLVPKLKAALSAEDYTAAYERGKTQILDEIVKGILEEED
jgi:serine/threonine protein kinase